MWKQAITSALTEIWQRRKEWVGLLPNWTFNGLWVLELSIPSVFGPRVATAQDWSPAAKNKHILLSFLSPLLSISLCVKTWKRLGKTGGRRNPRRNVKENLQDGKYKIDLRLFVQPRAASDSLSASHLPFHIDTCPLTEMAPKTLAPVLPWHPTTTTVLLRIIWVRICLKECLTAWLSFHFSPLLLSGSPLLTSEALGQEMTSPIPNLGS